MIYLMLALCVFLSDLMAKKYVEARFGDEEEKSFLHDRVQIRKAHNPGLALGVLKDRPGLVQYLTGLVMVFFAVRAVIAIARKGSRAACIGLAMVTGGALSNWFDRFHQGYVTDYIRIRTKWKAFSKIIFNLGDAFIVLGSLLVFFSKKD